MSSSSTHHAAHAALAVAEFREFAGFSAAEQRFIARSLELGLASADSARRWERDAAEAAAIAAQRAAYRDLSALRHAIVDGANQGSMGPFFGALVALTAFDLGQERIECFSAYRFLYERLLGPLVRPWLPAAFCAAAALPQIRPGRRKLLLRSISEAAVTAAGWSCSAPSFFPEWVEPEPA